MQILDGRPVYSATDLVGFLACEHLTDLERLATAHRLQRPLRDDAELDAIAERGKQHEQRYLDELSAAGRAVTDLDAPWPDTWEERPAYLARQAARTRAAIAAGDDVIFQACFLDGPWLGFADFLLRVPDERTPTGFSYEVADTKLAHRAKASALIQICVYDELLSAIQGVEPIRMHVALGGRERETKTFRTADFSAFYRSVRTRFLAAVAAPLPGSYESLRTYPEPVEHCGVCRWDARCSARRRADDHLALVAGIAGRTRSELSGRGIGTRRSLAAVQLPLEPRLEGTSAASLTRVREQARLQVEGDAVKPGVLHELLDPARDEDGGLATDVGLLKLPAPSPGDLFLDLEGDPFAGDDGIDYLFGILEPGRRGPDGKPRFHAFWSRDRAGRITPAAERRAFEATIDLIMARLAQDPGLHIYHYAPYEPSHFGRLMGRYGTREDEVDRLLRGDRLVDLYGVVRQGIRASVESYSIKQLEPLYGFERRIGLRDAGSSIAEFERWLRLDGEGHQQDTILGKIEAYNRDDVLSTWRLRDWLEGRRDVLGARLGEPLPRPPIVDGTPPDGVTKELDAVGIVTDALLSTIAPEDQATGPADAPGGATWLLAQLLGWHRREEKPDWWRYFHQLTDLDEDGRLEAPEPLAMLELIGPTGEDGRTFRYRYPRQEFDLGRHPMNTATQKAMTVVELDRERREIELRFKAKHEIVHPPSLVSTSVVPASAQKERLLDIGRWVGESGIDAPGRYRAARDLLLRRRPRLRDGTSDGPLAPAWERTADAARRLVTELDHTTLAIQGPPGSGKTYNGARMILDLVAAGKRVGVTAMSHKVIGKLLTDIDAAVRDDPEFRDRTVRIGQKPGDDKEPTCSAATLMKDADAIADAFDEGIVDVVGGTAWLWASAKMSEKVDVLFVDEAGQFSLANTVAVSAAADSLVLLGDPQQLDQVLKGSHPPGAERSALAHLLDGQAVMPADRGLFIERTWRLHPDLCDFTSERFYEGSLLPEPGNERQGLRGIGLADGVGLRFVEVDHVAAGNDSDSSEEATVVADIVGGLLDGGATWTDRDGHSAIIRQDDILIITPYNDQRMRIEERLAARGSRSADVAVGTVDKFQGQQAPISIYSMATSSPADAPRGMEFLYSMHRLNVATSRARCLALVVASPALLRPDVKTPRQMQLANALCRLVEVARA